MERSKAKLALLTTALLVGAMPARAEVSPLDGYTADGAYRVNIELAPYAWLPASGGQVGLGNGASASFGTGIPTLSDLANHLHFSFLGDARLRYGPWSAELNVDYITASGSKLIAPDILGIPRTLGLTTSLTRVAPGFGYQVYNGGIGGIPATVDARAGFVWFSTSTTVDLHRFLPDGQTRVAGAGNAIDFVQPWLGLRADIYPWPRWRLELSAQGQGFGVDGGSWGWGVTASATWAVNNWFNLIGGFAALNNSGKASSARAVRSVDLTAYGPFLGMSFTF